MYGGRTQDGTLAGNAAIERGRGGAGRRELLFFELGEAEVQDLDVSIASKKDIFRLEIAVDDSRLMGAGERRGRLNTEIENFEQRQRAAPDLGTQRFAFDQLHYQEGTCFELTGIVDRDDVGMVQCGGGPCFLRKAPHAIGMTAGFGSQNFYGNVPLEGRIAGTIDNSHAPFAEFPCDAITSDGAANEGHATNLATTPA